ncbi:hypothetical protein INR49_018184 [Caranx melampygus]|nr:hypothetical protein INR49_018184 [Caranx melampygus]
MVVLAKTLLKAAPCLETTRVQPLRTSCATGFMDVIGLLCSKVWGSERTDARSRGRVTEETAPHAEQSSMTFRVKALLKPDDVCWEFSLLTGLVNLTGMMDR